MTDQYHLNLEKYSLDKFFKGLKNRIMIPSRQILKEDINRNFKILKEHGISNLLELVNALKTKQKIDSFSETTGLSIEYLILLNREVKSFHSNPVRLDKFSALNAKHFEILKSTGIKNTKHMLDRADSIEKRIKLSKTTNIPLKDLNKLVCLSDLARAYGVGPAFAQMIYEIGIHTITEFVEVPAKEFIEIYEEKMQKKADFGFNEIQFSLDLANELEPMVEI